MKRTSDITRNFEISFNQYATFLDLATSDTYQEKVTADWSSKVTNVEFVVLYNSHSSNDALVKINNGDEIVVPAGMMRSFGIDNVTKIEYKSKSAGNPATLTIEVYGRSDVDI